MNFHCPICKRIAIYEVSNSHKNLIRKNELKQYFIHNELLRYGVLFEKYPYQEVVIGRTEKEFIRNIREEIHEEKLQILALPNCHISYISKNQNDLLDYMSRNILDFIIPGCFCKITI